MTASDRSRAPAWLSTRTLLAVALVALAGAACERTADDGHAPERQSPSSGPIPGFVVGQIVSRVGAASSQPIEGLDEIEVARRFRSALLALPMFEDEGRGVGPTIDFTLEHGLGMGQVEPPGGGSGAAAGGPYIVLMLRAEGGAERDPRFQFEVQGLYREPVGADETPLAAAQRLLDAGVADVVDGIRAEAVPRVSSDAEVVALLEGAEDTALLALIRETHRRRLAAASPRLRALLARDDLEVVIAAATALGRVRDAEAVSPLIDLISREHRELTELVLPILGEIGSNEARLYLETVADAHQRASIRALAREILDGMEPVP